ncbi:MAG: response regulator, partial [Anaerolineaceae bacterium]|nr:response regulator [Anaerolineaceae bacterium]
FGFYHVSLFLMDERGAYATIRESTGEAGKELRARGHKLAAGSRSVVGNVAASGTPLVVNDVKSSNLYYPNPLLPETRSEMGIPLKIGRRIIGILDIQASLRNAFSQDDITVLQILGDQIAIAIENARAYELSQKAVEEMKEVDRLKSQFIANMSHELRTPLNSIIGFSRVILKGIDGPINETQTQDLSSIYNSGQHLLRLITDILDLSKLDAGKMELQFSDINIVDMINSVLTTAVGFVKEKPVKLVQNLSANLPLVKADATRVRQVLLNLLSNAGKFTDEGTVTVEAEVTTEFNNRPEVLIKVIDTGPGIAEKDQSKLFQSFSQVDDSPTRKTGGTGLGLSISRSLIEMHGGRIGLLWSEVGKGSCFYFTLPLTVKDNQSLPKQPESSGNVILAIDDDRKVITLYERYLEEQGYQVIPLTDPTKAVERARQIMPFAITVDIMMPGKDGWEVIHDLKNDPTTKHIPIIICSIMEEKDRGFSLGASDYLVKPFLQEEIVNSLNRLNKDGKIHEILVIDDSAEDLRLAKKVIEENSKFKVRTVQGGKNGLEEVKSSCPDAIILDLFMPDLDGFAVLEALRSEQLYQNIPVIILTGADLTPDQHQMLSDFGNQMLSKSMLKEKDLLASLEDALKKIQSQPRRPQMHTKPLG